MNDITDRAQLVTALHDVRFLGGIAASGAGAAFGGNLFTRDALAIVSDSMHVIPSMARELFSLLPQRQGSELLAEISAILSD